MSDDGSDNVAENVIETVLQRLRDKKKIAGFHRSKKNDSLDASGIDFLIILNNGLAIPLQCKTYSRKNDLRLTEHRRKHPEIKYIIFVVTHGYNQDKDKIYLMAEKDLLDIIKNADRL